MKINNRYQRYNWNKVEKQLGKELPLMYKNVYEEVGSEVIDDYFYVVRLFKYEGEEGVEEFTEYVEYAYGVLEKWLTEDEKIKIGVENGGGFQ